MTTLVLTVIGDDRSGLVDALSGVIAEHGGSWERSHMSRLAGKFAGIVVVTVPDQRSGDLAAALEPMRDQGLLDVTAEVATGAEPPPDTALLTLHLIGQDRPGIVHEISRALNENQVSIEELATETKSAPMSAEMLFEATATLRAPAAVDRDQLRRSLEKLADELMVDIDLGGPDDH